MQLLKEFNPVVFIFKIQENIYLYNKWEKEGKRINYPVLLTIAIFYLILRAVINTNKTWKQSII